MSPTALIILIVLMLNLTTIKKSTTKIHEIVKMCQFALELLYYYEYQKLVCHHRAEDAGPQCNNSLLKWRAVLSDNIFKNFGKYIYIYINILCVYTYIYMCK